MSTGLKQLKSSTSALHSAARKHAQGAEHHVLLMTSKTPVAGKPSEEHAILRLASRVMVAISTQHQYEPASYAQKAQRRHRGY